MADDLGGRVRRTIRAPAIDAGIVSNAGRGDDRARRRELHASQPVTGRHASRTGIREPDILALLTARKTRPRPNPGTAAARGNWRYSMTNQVDPIDFELFKNALFATADEMAVTVCRTTYSGVLRDNMDFSTSVTDARGSVIAQGLTLPMHLGSVPTALAAVLAHYDNDMRDGDVFVLNDPFEGGMHLPDIFMFKPVFVDGERVAFACCTAHQADVGGRVPGSNAADSTEIYQEGLRIPPMKLLDGGERNDTLWRLIERNVRIPVQVSETCAPSSRHAKSPSARSAPRSPATVSSLRAR